MTKCRQCGEIIANYEEDQLAVCAECWVPDDLEETGYDGDGK
jgi:uncharacterized OB-fold protein